MNADKNEAEKLPDGWVLCTSKSNPGRKYYFNKKTGKSSWTQPQATENGQKPQGKGEKVREQGKSEESPKKNLKRKSDSCEQGTSQMKLKDIPTPDKQRPATKESPIIPSPSIPETSSNHNDKRVSKRKRPTKKVKNLANHRLEQFRARLSEEAEESSSDSSPANKSIRKHQYQQTPLKKTSPYLAKHQSPVKKSSPNLANNRLTQFRARLSAEAQDSSGEPSPSKKTKASPKVTQTETKSSKTESPNDTKATTTSQSPTNDSLQSIPSPSQFFTANKIISSMKAQLPEKYCDKVRQKNTFADIEQEICNQISEYPFMKHPATPPQFSEASKLVCAINSKLSRVPSKDNLKTYSSASEKLNYLQSSLNDTTEADEDIFLKINNARCPIEPMDVDFKETRQQAPTISTQDAGSQVVFVVDTNIFIHELDVIKNVLNSNVKGYTEQPILLVPWRVINELDRLKDINNCSGAIWKRAKSAMDYLYKSMPENGRLRGQPLRDANSHIYPCESPDDEILNCCLQQKERGKSVILLSNDKNLCSKALINSVKSLGHTELKGLLEDKPRETADPGLSDHVKHYENSLFQLLSNILENEMRAKYNNLWQRVVFKAPPWTLADVLQCLLKHWIAVFNEVFPRIEHLLTDLKNSLASIESKDPNSLSESVVSNFKELCLDVAKKCQIIPEYMALAKLTVERLSRGRAGDPDDDRTGESVVKEAFEGVWTVFSSYCAKISSCLGVSHNIEDKLPGNDPIEVLTSKFELFSDQICSLTIALKGTLSTDPSDPSIEEQVTHLETVFKESLVLISMDAAVVNRRTLTMFCTKCRNLLQMAHNKFSELTELLEVCKNSIVNT